MDSRTSDFLQVYTTPRQKNAAQVLVPRSSHPGLPRAEFPYSLHLGPRLINNVVSLRKRPNSLYLQHTTYLHILVLCSSTYFSTSAGPLPAPATPAPAALTQQRPPVTCRS
jgi:hypothetical protein